MTARQDENRPPGGFVPLGKNLEEVKALSLAAISVIERAATYCANDLAARTELNERDRIAAFDAFISALTKEAWNAPLEGFLEADEAGGKAILCGFIDRIAQAQRIKLLTD